MSIEEPTLALQYITVAFSQNPAWAQAEIGESTYAEIGASPLFHRWVTARQEQDAVAAFEHLQGASKTDSETRVRVSRRLLETGHPTEALIVVSEILQSEDESVDLRLLRAAAYEASGDYRTAIEQCQLALKAKPSDLRVQLRLARIKQRQSGTQ